MSGERPGHFGDALATAKAQLVPGLTADEISSVEEQFGFRFNSDHAAFLSEVLPTGPLWPDWRHGSTEELQWILDGPCDGVLFDVERNSFWPPGWGARPADVGQAIRTARDHLAGVPKMIPVYGHRYTPAESPVLGAYPVFSVVQTDVIYYGRDVDSYLKVEFAGEPVIFANTIPTGEWMWPESTIAQNEEVRVIWERLAAVYVPFWSELAENRSEDI